jgi:hypothetical protein
LSGSEGEDAESFSVALELRAHESPLERMAGVAARGGRFLSRIVRARRRYGTDVAVRLVARRSVSFAVRVGSSVICAWHEGMALPGVKVAAGIQLDELRRDRLAEIVALMRKAGWKDSEAVVAKRLDGGRRCFGARRNGALIGQVWTSRSPHNYEELWDMRLESDEARTFDWYTLPAARGQHVVPALLSLAVQTLRAEGVRHVYTSIGGDNRSSLRAAAQVFPVRREFLYFMARGMRRPVVLGMARSTYPTLDPVERPFERINVTNLVL